MLIGNQLLMFLLSLDLWSIGYVIVFIVVAAAFELARNAQMQRARLMSMAVLAWFAIAVVFNIVSTTVYVIRGADVSHMLLTGTVPYTLASGTTVSVSDAFGAKAVVINDSPNPVRFEAVRYGSSPSSATSSGFGMSIVGPYSIGLIEHRPDHFGPYDHPPHSVKVRGHAGSAVRYWLTW